MPAIQLRVATLDDTALLLEMMEDFNAFEQISWQRTSALPAIRQLVTSPQLGTIGLIHEHDTVQGYFVMTWGFDLEWYGRDAFLTELYLRPAVRGRKLGREALAEAQRFAAAHGARALHLMVRPENAAAIRLYLGAGFTSPPRVFLTKPLTDREEEP